MKTARVLVVDDQASMRNVLSEYLSNEGYSVTLSEDGERAWSALLQNNAESFDVLISDRTMPNMDGLELLQRVKADSRFKDIPVIFQTALTNKGEVLEGINAGVYYYLTKPYDYQLLLAVVANAVNDSKSQQQLREKSLEHQRALRFLNRGEFQCRTMGEAKQIAPMLAQLFPDPQRVVTGLSELLFNAIEHGNLGISYQEKSDLLVNDSWLDEIERRLLLTENLDKYVSIRIKRDEAGISIMITDQGSGFDFKQYLDFDPERAAHSHGRGIALSRLLSFDELEYLGSGNRVKARVFS